VYFEVQKEGAIDLIDRISGKSYYNRIRV